MESAMPNTSSRRKRWWRDGDTVAMVVAYAGASYLAVRVLQGIL